jgi:uncharacterized protein (DUF1015 family)
VRFLYIADGHHRTAAAARVYLKRIGSTAEPSVPMDPHPSFGHPLPSDERGRGEGPGHPDGRGRGSVGGCAYFMSVIFPHTQLQILPYNRVLKDLNGLNPEQFLAKLQTVFALNGANSADPARPHELCLYLKGQWHTLHIRPHLLTATDPVENLDVTLLQRLVLDPVLGIADPRTSGRIGFVGGIRGTAELERLVNGGEYACAFSLFPTRIEELMTIADAGGVMPPKSTWFEPKLRDALFCHLL